MPTLISKKYKNKSKWYIVENSTIETGKTKRIYLENLGQISKSEAKLHLANYVTAKKRTGASKMSLKQAFEKFKAYYQAQIDIAIKAGTFIIFCGHEKKIIDLLGHLILKDIDFETIQYLKNTLKNKYNLSNRFINMHLTELKKVLEFAVEKGWLRDIPKIKRMSEAKESKKIERLNRDEFEQLCQYANSEQLLYLKLMFYSGLRPFESCHLKWSDIDFNEDVIEVRSNNPKKPGRVIPLHPKLKELLLGIQREDEFVSPFRKSAYARRSLERLFKYCNVRCTPYMLRKTFGSTLADEGVNPMHTAEIMGHAKLETTYKHYTKVNLLSLKQSLAKL